MTLVEYVKRRTRGDLIRLSLRSAVAAYLLGGFVGGAVWCQDCG